MSEWITRLRKAFVLFDPGDYRLVRNLFLRSLGFVYFCAFASLWTQVRGLSGEHGILPVGDFIKAVGTELGGIEKYHQLPTFCWIGAGDHSLLAQCAVGSTFSLVLVVGFVPALILPLLWLLWLSLTVACRDFLGFQWENLLLEAGFLAIFLAPAAWRLTKGREPSRLMIWLFWWLLFRLMFLSGMVKLLSGDPAWRDFTALSYHYETQPLPTLFGWYANQLPSWMHVMEMVVMYGIELIVPFLIFFGRRARIVACLLFVLLQAGIASTGNYCYFNLLTIVLSLLLLDDQAILRLTPAKWRGPMADTAGTPRSEHRFVTGLRYGSLGLLTAVILIMSCTEMSASLGLMRGWSGPGLALYRVVQPFRSINSYGLFAVMTKTRPEIIVEGSDDGPEWKAYEFKYKPGNLKRRPQFVAPHQPRLDWQMWFAALGTYERNPWFVNFCIRLLRGTPEVLALLEENPFSEKPPKYVRATLYNYKFSDRQTLRKTGEWWKREYLGIYLPPISLKEPQN